MKSFMTTLKEEN